MKEWVCPDCESGRAPSAEVPVGEETAAESPPVIPDSVYGEPVKIDVKDEPANVCEPKRKVHPLFHKLDPGYFRPLEVEWDGDPEHIPAEWKGRWVVVENDGCLDCRHQLHVNPVETGYLKCGRGGRAVITMPFGSYKDNLRPGLFSTREAAERAVANTFLDGERSHWWGVFVNRENPLLTMRSVRDGWADGREKLCSYPWFAVMRIEELRLRRKSDIRREIREIREKEMGLPKNPQSKPVQQFGSAAVPSRTEPAVGGHPKPGMTDYADYLIRQKENREKGILYTPYRREDEGKVVADWSKVDWEAERRESDRKERAYVAETSRKPNAAQVWYVLKDWNSDGYLRVPNKSKGEEGDAWLEPDIKNCTVFRSAEEASRVATAIERMFWKTAYAKMNLHVCLLQDELPTLEESDESV